MHSTVARTFLALLVTFAPFLEPHERDGPDLCTS